MADRLNPPEGWFTFGHHVDQPTIVLEFSSEVDEEDGLPLWERPKVEGAEEEKVGVLLQYATGNQIGGQPQVIGVHGEVTISGVMEVVAIIERGGLVNPESVVNEAEAAIVRLFDVGRASSEPADLARDIVAVLAERGLLRS
jgi:hypothetical protein